MGSVVAAAVALVLGLVAKPSICFTEPKPPSRDEVARESTSSFVWIKVDFNDDKSDTCDI